MVNKYLKLIEDLIKMSKNISKKLEILIVGSFPPLNIKTFMVDN